MHFASFMMQSMRTQFDEFRPESTPCSPKEAKRTVDGIVKKPGETERTVLFAKGLEHGPHDVVTRVSLLLGLVLEVQLEQRTHSLHRKFVVLKGEA